MRTYFSNRIYKNELDEDVNNIIKELLLNYSYIRNYAYSLICKEKMGKITFKNSYKEPFNSLYYRLENRFPNVIGRRCLGMNETIPTRFNQFTDWKEIYNFIK